MAVETEIDLEKVAEACKSIFQHENASTLTGKQLRILIASEIGTSEETLATDTMRQYLDELILKHLTEEMEKESPSPSPEEDMTDDDEGDAGIDDSSELEDQAPSKKKTKRKPTSKTSKLSADGGKSKAEARLDRLKNFVFKCGVRKVWKRELEGLSPNAAIKKVMGILEELGMEGRPTLEKCKAIKERREFEEELKAVQTNAVLPSRLRSQASSTARTTAKHAHAASDSDEGPMPMRPPSKVSRLDLSAFGDPESE